jgi:hypothetical protein
MSLRDYFAAHAPEMPGVWANNLPREKLTDPASLYALWRYEYADAMLAERSKP